MKIAAACPGDFHLGFDSLVRGEGRWWLLVMRTLAQCRDYDVHIIGQHNKEYHEEESGITFLNIQNMKAHGDFDIVFSMDPWPRTGVDENWISPLLNNIDTKYRVFAPFFNNEQANKSCTIPVVYPYYYEDHTCFPICPGSNADLLKLENNFGKKNVVWFSKNSHENPEYLWASLSNAIDYVNDADGFLVVVDGHTLLSCDYPNKSLVLKKIDTYQHRIKLLNQWLPYSDMRRILKSSAFITGIHHPVANPMSLDIVFDGGVVLQFENQRWCAPYDRLLDVAHIKFDKAQENDIHDWYHNIFYNKQNYEDHRRQLVSIAKMYTEQSLLTNFDLFVNSLK